MPQAGVRAPHDIALTSGVSIGDRRGLMMKISRTLIVVAIGTAVVTGLIGCSTSETASKPTMEIKEVMKAGFKGVDPALKGADTVAGRIGAGTATDADLKLMVDLTWQLTLNQPPEGELASWTAKAAAIHSAAKGLAAKAPGALDVWKTASNCKDCHSVHKPK